MRDPTNAQFHFLVVSGVEGKGLASGCAVRVLGRGWWEETCWEFSLVDIMSTRGISS